MVRLIHQVTQSDRRVLDVAVLVLPGSYFGGRDSAAVHLSEIAVGELVPGLRVLGLFVVDAGCQFAYSAQP